MAVRQLLATIALLALAAAPCVLACRTTASPFFGVPWKSSFAMYSTENGWKKHGGVSKINLFYNKESGCLTGLKVTYGNQGESARLLGTDRVGQATSELNLQPKELVNDAIIKYSSCITFLSLTTNRRKVLAIGNSATPGTLQASSPGPEGGFLAYMKAYTDDAGYGALQRLQLVWATLDCAGSPAKAPQPIDAPAADYKLESAEQAGGAAAGASMVQNAEPVAATVVSGQGSVTEVVTEVDAAGAAEAVAAPASEPTPTPAAEQSAPAAAAAPPAEEPENTPVETSVTATATADVTSVADALPAADATPAAADATTTTTTATTTTIATTTASSSPAAAGSCSPGAACKDGSCLTSSCALNGMGKDVLTMMCFGTNIVPNPILDATTGNPCTNLACKLDRPNCTSAGLLGLGGFCTGKVVSMGATAKLHPVGQNFIGYPCIEHKGAVLDLLPVGDYTAKGTYAAKAWKVCDCIQGFAIHEGSIGVMARSDGDVSLTLPSLPTLPHFPFVNKGLSNMSLPDVMAQWVAANQADIKLPQVELSPKQIKEVELVLPEFEAPSVLVSKLSAPLFRKPTNFRLPVFNLPFGNNTLNRLSLAIPDLTSLPTLVVPRLKKPVMPTVTVTVPEVTIPNLFDLAPAFGVPTLPKLPPVFNMSFQDAVMQWMAAKAMNLQVPELRLHEQVIKGLQSLVDGFVAPALLVSDISLPLFQPPKGLLPKNLPVIVLGRNQSSAVSQILPRLTALPTFVLPQQISFRLPKIDLPTVTVPNVTEVVSSLGAHIPQWPKMPLALPSMNVSLPQLQLPDLEAMLGKHRLPGSNRTGLRLPEAMDAVEQPGITTPNFQLDFSGIQEIAAAIRAGLRGKLPQIEEVTIEKLVPAPGGSDGAVSSSSSSEVVSINGQDVDSTPKVGSSSTTTSSSTTVTTVPNADAATAADTATSGTAAVAVPAAAEAPAPAVAAPAAAVAAVTTTTPSVGDAGEVISETEVTVATPVPVAAPVPAPAPNQRVAGSSKASGGSTWSTKQQQ